MCIFFAVTTQLQVGFNAHSIQNHRRPARHKPLIFKGVVFNAGNGYNNTDGYFYVPHSGLYYFSVTAGNHYQNKHVRFCLYVDDTKLTRGYSHSSFWDFNTAHAVVHLNKGQRVWVKSASPDSHSYTELFLCSFTGLLVRPDL